MNLQRRDVKQKCMNNQKTIKGLKEDPVAFQDESRRGHILFDR